MTETRLNLDVTFIGALIAGFLSFLSPCVLPLVPPYLCFLGGTTFDQLTGEDETPSHVYRTVVLSAVAFVLGFTTVFVILGATATAAGQLLLANLPLLSKIAGVIIIIAGLHFLGLIHLPFLHREARYHADARPAGLIGAYVIGLAFAFGWTPCIGPILGAVLTQAESEATLGRGVTLLFAYSLGLGVPFVYTGLAFGRMTAVFSWVRGHFRLINLVSGLALTLFGVLLLTDNVTWLSLRLIDFFDALHLGALSDS